MCIFEWDVWKLHSKGCHEGNHRMSPSMRIDNKDILLVGGFCLVREQKEMFTDTTAWWGAWSCVVWQKLEIEEKKRSVSVRVTGEMHRKINHLHEWLKSSGFRCPVRSVTVFKPNMDMLRDKYREMTLSILSEYCLAHKSWEGVW